MNLLLSYADKPGSAKDILLTPANSLLIGRHPASDLVLHGNGVSGSHARVYFDKSEGWKIEDLNSKNGTYINGNKITVAHRITEACTIRLGPSGPVLRASSKAVASGQNSSIKSSAYSPSAQSSTKTSAEQRQPLIRNSRVAYNIQWRIIALTLIASVIGIFAYDKYRSTQFASGKIHESVPEKSSDSKDKIDAAAEIGENIHYYPDAIQPELDDEDQYRRAIGDMARIQAEKLFVRSKSRDFPTIVLGRQGFSKCETSLSPGIYNPACREILVAFNTGLLQFESPIEVLYVLAHEYAHHLVEITLGSSVSGLDNELTADCFAGYMAGFWSSNNKLSEQELMAGFLVMQSVAKAEPDDSTDMHGDPGQRKGAFLGGYAMATGKITQEYQNFCRTLDRIIKV